MRKALVLAARVALGGVFLYAASTKLHPPLSISLSLFALQIDSYQLLPPWAVGALAHTLPWLEAALGLALLTGWQLRYVASLMSALLVGFFSVMLRTHLKGMAIDCGCFGPNEKLGVGTLVRDGTLMAVSLGLTVAAFLSPRKASSPHHGQP